MDSTPGQTPVIFGTAIEGFARTYGHRLSPALKQGMASRGIDLDDIQSAYSLEVFERVMRPLGEALYPELDDAARWQRMGLEFVTGFVQTTMGKATLTLAKVLGPRRTLERIVRTFRTGSNYLGAEAKVLGPTELELRTWMLEEYLQPWRGRPTLHLDYRLGILQGMMTELGTKGAEVALVEKDWSTQSARYRVRWSA